MGKIYPTLFLFLVITLILPYPVSFTQQKKLQIKGLSILWSSPEYSSEPIGLNVADLYHNGSLKVIFYSGRIIYCLNGVDGVLTWSYQTDADLRGPTALGDLNGDGILDIVVRAHIGKSVFAVNGLNGSLLWRKELKSNIFTYVSLCAVDEDGGLEVLVGDSDGTFYALNGSNGVILWEYEINGSIKMYAPPAVGDLDNDGKNEVIFFGGDGYAYALNGEDGSLLWRFNAGQQVLSSAALADVDDDGRLEVIFGVIGSSQKYGYIYTLNGEDGSILWKRKIEEKGKYFYSRYPAFSSPVLGDIDGDGRLEIILSSYIRWIFALNGEDGSILWKYYVGTWSRCSPVIGDLDRDNQLDVLFNSGYEFYAIDGKRGEIIWKTYSFSLY